MSLKDMPDPEFRALLDMMVAAGELERLDVEGEAPRWKLTEIGKARAAALIRNSATARAFAAQVTANKLIDDAKKEKP